MRRELGVIAGDSVAADDGRERDVRDAATGAVLASVPEMGAREAARACDAAERAMRRPPPSGERAAWLARTAALLRDRRSAIAQDITAENGKPLREAEGEVDYAAGFFAFYAGRLDVLAPRRLPERPRGCGWSVHHRPAGVAALITPWNLPLAMLAKKAAAALGAGCAFVAKPAEATPLSAVALLRALLDAGVPEGWANLVIGEPQPIGAALLAHPAVRIVSFTGSTATGRRLMAAAAPGLKRLSLELGGNAPFLVFDGADPELAAEALVASKFRAAGQTCVCANRVLVQRPMHEAFMAALLPRVARLRVGDGRDSASDLGPLIDRRGWDKVAAHLQDALARGARLRHGTMPTPPAHAWGCWFPPVVVDGMDPGMLLCREETFGPLLAIGSFADEDEAVALADGGEHGLAGYVFTADHAQAQRIASRLRVGHLGINTGVSPTPEAPFGGMKQSGFGREGGDEGLLEFCETQTVAMP